MRWIRVFPSWQTFVGLLVVSAMPLLVDSLRGVETTNRVAHRPEQIDLDPSVKETPALPAATDEPEASGAGADVNSADADLADTPASDAPSQSQQHAASQSAARNDHGGSATFWPRPTALVEQLTKLAELEPSCADWAARTRSELDRLAALPALGDRGAAAILQRLSALAEESREIARGLSGEESRSRLLRAGFAIVRRLAIWEPAYRAAGGAPSAPVPPGMAAESRQRLRTLVARVETELPRTGDVGSWRTYLLLDNLHGEIDRDGGNDENLRLVARELLYRLHSTQLSDVQAGFLQGPAFDNLSHELKAVATEPADLPAVLGAVEAYEHQDHAAAAIRMADLYDRLRWSTNPHVAELAAAINTYYRNANVRVAVSAELVNRLLPAAQVVSEPVVDRIQNAHVEGESQTSTKVHLVLLPTRGRWEFGIEANGDVNSSTTSYSGPARFYQNAWSNFRARKRLTVDRRGIRLFQAEAQANADTQLNDFETEFDGIPLLSGLARAIARNQYEQKSPAARHEVEGKISYRASAELDKQVADRLEKSKRDFQRQLVQPLQKLELEPTAVDMETTQERLIARYRLAGRDQVSAYTPRPQAPGDSLLSVQIHESALNNVLSHLKLEGRRVDLITLYKEMTSRFSEKQVPVPEDIPDDVFVTFAEEDPVRVDCQEGRVRLTIQLQSLEEGGDVRWRNLSVIANYKPDSEQRDANLVRDGIFELPKTTRTRDRVALSAIFGKVLNRNRKLNLINERIAKSPKLADQQVTQFVIHDGWIGVALGPKTQQRQAQAKERQQQ